jgi:hypothetical protein
MHVFLLAYDLDKTDPKPRNIQDFLAWCQPHGVKQRVDSAWEIQSELSYPEFLKKFLETVTLNPKDHLVLAEVIGEYYAFNPLTD